MSCGSNDSPKPSIDPAPFGREMTLGFTPDLSGAAAELLAGASATQMAIATSQHRKRLAGDSPADSFKTGELRGEPLETWTFRPMFIWVPLFLEFESYCVYKEVRRKNNFRLQKIFEPDEKGGS